MTKEKIAAMLDGRQYGEITDAETALAKENDLVVIFGASDDLCEFRGAIYDEFDCYDGGVIYCDQLPESIETVWGKNDISWTYETTMPHASFRIYDDDELYCIGIVIDLKEVSSAKHLTDTEKLSEENTELKRLLQLASSEVHRPYPEYKYRFELEAEKLMKE